MNLSAVTTWSFADGVNAPPPPDEGNGPASLHVLFLGDVIRAVRDGATAPWLVEATEGRRNVGILTALYESAVHDGAPIAPQAGVTPARPGAVAGS